MDESFEDPYSVLGVAKDADAKEIRAAYLRLVREHPPERSPEKFRSISAAYQLLSNPEKRRAFDATPRVSAELGRMLENGPEIEDPEKRIPFLESLKERFPEERILDEWIGYLKLDVGRAGEAEDLFRGLSLERPNDMRLRRCLGRAIIQSGRLDEGLAILEATAALDPTDIVTWYWLAHELVSAARFEAAISALDRGMESDGKVDAGDFPLLFQKLQMLTTARLWPQAEEVGRRITDVAMAEDAAAREHCTQVISSMLGAELRSNSIESAGLHVEMMRRLSPDDAKLKDFEERIVPHSRVLRSARALEGDAKIHVEIRNWVTLVLATPQSHDDRKRRNEALDRFASRYADAMFRYAGYYDVAAAAHPELFAEIREQWDSLTNAIIEARRRAAESRARTHATGRPSGAAVFVAVLLLIGVILRFFPL